MTTRLSETPLLYQPVGPLEKLKADLERFSDPAQFDQDDPRLRMILQDLRARVDGMTIGRQLLDRDDEHDKLVSYLRSLLTDEDEVRDVLRWMREQRLRERQQPMPTDSTAPDWQAPDDATLRRILRGMRTVAVVGVSPNPVRPSHYVARYLSLRGYRVIPVNPGHAGETLFGETVRARLADCPPETDAIDVFRRSDQVPPLVAEAIEHLPALRTVWLQIGVESPQAWEMARARGLDFVQNRCPKIEYQRLFGELRMGGFNTGIISSKL